MKGHILLYLLPTPTYFKSIYIPFGMSSCMSSVYFLIYFTYTYIITMNAIKMKRIL